MSSPKRAKKRLEDFNCSSRGKKCPLCGKCFDDCPHSIAQAIERFEDDLLMAKIETVLGKKLDSQEFRAKLAQFIANK